MFSSVFFKELKELGACGNEETGKFFLWKGNICDWEKMENSEFFSRKIQNSEKFRVFQQKLISVGGKDAGSTFLPRNTFVLPDLLAMIRRTLWIC